MASKGRYVDTYAYRSSSECYGIETSVDEETIPPSLPSQNIDLRTFDTEKWNEKFQVALKNMLAMRNQ